MPFAGFHWWDLIIPVVMLLILIGGLVIAGWSIGAGYAWLRRRQERQPENR